ncbi:MAG: hypothetical protein UHX91_03620, partial [Methanosphaera sp.]|nr:hypothetical protein [Methanosphaera sp.]
MNVKKTHFIFLAVLLVAMMSVAVAADVNDSTDESVTTPAVTHTTDNTDVQTTVLTENEIKKDVTETVTKESISGQTRAITPTTHNVNNTTFDTYFKAAGFESNVNAGDTLNFTGNVNRFNSSYKVDKAVIITGNGFTLDLNTTSGSYTGNETGNSFNIINTGYTNITNINFHNTQIFVKNSTHVTFDNVNITVYNQRIGSGVGVLSIRENSTYVTVKNSYIHTCNNSGSSSIVLAQADYCTIDNNTIIGEGNVGNLVYLTTYNIPNVLYTDVNTNTYNNITNNRISTVNLSGGVCVGVVVSGHSNKFEGNNVSVASSFSGQWISPYANLTGDFNDTYEGNSYINNKVYGSFTGTKNSTITGNIFHSSVSLPERCKFKNNNAENSTVTVTGPNCDLCNNSMNILKVNNNAVNTRVCWDNDILLINIIDPAGNVVRYVHPFSLNTLNKKNNQLTKTEGEPSIFNITKDNFDTYFMNQRETYMFNPSSDGVYNLCYIPPTTEGLYFYFMGKDCDCTIIGKDITLTNIPITILEPRITISDITLIYDENFVGSIPITVSNMKMSGNNFYTILDNITIITNRDYVENMYNLVIQAQGSDSNVTIKNSIINATLVSASNLKLVENRASNTKFINNNITFNEKDSYGENPSFTVFGERGVENVNNLVFENNNITMTGAIDDGTLYAFKMNSNGTQIKNNNITVTTTGTANGVELNGNDNTVTDNYIVTNDKLGDDAVTVTGENNVVKNNKPSFTITDETYGDFFDDECLLKESYNNTDLKVSGDITGKVFIFDGVNITITNDGTAELKDCQIMVGNDARVVFDGLVINNEDMEAIVLESSGNVINNSEIIVSSAYPLHAVEIAEDGNIITNTIITATIASADVAYDKDYVGLPQSSALYISSNNNLLDNVTVSVDGTSVAEGSYYPSIDAIDFQSTGKGVVIENNTITKSKVIATGSNYVYGINVGRAKDTTIENVNIDVDSDYYTNGIQLFDAVDITIDGTIDSTAATQAYGVYATAMAVGTSSGIDLTGLNITVESPDATGVLIEGASDVIIADATYDIQGGSTTAVNAHVDWMGNIPKNINITGMDININGTEDNSILYFGLCDGVT